MTSFRHAGDLGDLVYAMPAIRYLGGGELHIEAQSYTRVSLSRDKWCGIDKLFLAQPYITGVREYVRGNYATYDLNQFRPRLSESLRKGEHRDRSLCDWVLLTHSIPLSAKDTPWLTVEPKTVAPVVFNRTGAGRPAGSCYHNFRFPWHRVWKKYGRDAVFIGTRAEHEMFCATCGEVPYHETKDLLEAAQVIAGAKLFIGNQSVCHAIAQGLFQRVILEVWPGGPNSSFHRDGVINVLDEKVELPEI